MNNLNFGFPIDGCQFNPCPAVKHVKNLLTESQDLQQRNFISLTFFKPFKVLRGTSSAGVCRYLSRRGRRSAKGKAARGRV